MPSFDVAAFARFRDRVFALLHKSRFHLLLADLSEQDKGEVKNGLDQKFARFMHEKFYLAVLGEQGMGKTSLINAILFEDEILPVEMDETTNVLCHVAYTEGDPRCVISFKDGRTIEGELTRDLLSEYVDNENNQANEKGVAEVHCYINNKNLKGGMTVTDTPGVESLTSVNVNVTFGFLPKIDAAIFLFKTNPPLTGTEVEFLTHCWAFTDKFFFVQNVQGESQADVDLAREDNLEKIRGIINQVRQGQGEAGIDEVTIHDVDVFEALEGACNDEPERMQASGLPALLEQVNGFLQENPVKRKMTQLAMVSAGEVDKARGLAQTRVKNLVNQDRKSFEQFTKEVEVIKAEMKEISDEWVEFRQEMDGKFTQFKRDFLAEVNEKVGEIRQKLYSIIDTGKLDRNFEKTVKSEIKTLSPIFVKNERKFQQRFVEPMKRKFADLVQRLEECSASLGECADDLDSLNTLRLVGDLAAGFGMAGGVAAGGTVLWAALTAFYAAEGWGLAAAGVAAKSGAAAAAPVPVWGWIVGGVLLVGGIAAVKIAKNKMKKKARKAVDETLAGVVNTVKKELVEKIDEAYDGFVAELDRRLEASLEEKRNELAILEEDRSQGREENLKTVKRVKEVSKKLDSLYKDMDREIRGALG